MRFPQLVIPSFAAAAAAVPGVKRAALPMRMSPSAGDTLLATVGRKPAETGDFLFGPPDRLGVDVVEFDEVGSEAATRTVYSPDATWANARLDFWEAQPGEEQRTLVGIAHSHPGEVGIPSGDLGPGKGDLGYARLMLRCDSQRSFVFAPILTGTGTDRVTVWPWILVRERAEEGFLWVDDFSVAPLSEFPRHGIRSSERDQCHRRRRRLPLDLEEVAASAQATLVFADDAWRFQRAGAHVDMTLPPDFPLSGPSFRLNGHPWSPMNWRDRHPHRAELRLSRAVRDLLNIGIRSY